MSTINERFSTLIKHLGISQNNFAKSIDTGSSRVSNIVTHKNKPDFNILHKILSIYSNLSAEWLILGRGEIEKEFFDGDHFNLLVKFNDRLAYLQGDFASFRKFDFPLTRNFHRTFEITSMDSIPFGFNSGDLIVCELVNDSKKDGFYLGIGDSFGFYTSKMNIPASEKELWFITHRITTKFKVEANLEGRMLVLEKEIQKIRASLK